MIQSSVFFVAGVVSIVIATKVYPFNRPEFDVLDSVLGKDKRGMKVGGGIMIGYAIFNMIWPA